MALRSLAVLALIALLGGCHSLVPDLGTIYDRAASYRGGVRNPIVVIPGILGSRLKDDADGVLVWGAFSGDFADPQTEDGARRLALPMRAGATLDELTDGVRPDGVLDSLEVDVFGLPIVLDAYRNILGVLGVGGYRDESLGASGAVDYGTDHYTCFQFPYDWRRDVAENAARLHAFLLEKEAFIRRKRAELGEAPQDDIQFDLVAHSMGGLLTRYYLRYGAAPLDPSGSLPELTWSGADKIDRAVLIGTPNAGSVDALTQLVQGVKLGPFTPHYEAAIVGTFPSVYELLPRGRHGPLVDDASVPYEDVLDPALWERMSWGLANPDHDDMLRVLLPGIGTAQERRRIALDHQAKCLQRARQFNAALDRPAAPPEGLDLYLIAGDAIDTPQRVRVLRQNGAISVIGHAPGDGTVLRSSALMDERVGGDWQPHLVSPIAWRQVHFLFRDHLGLTKDPAFVDNVLYILLEDPR